MVENLRNNMTEEGIGMNRLKRINVLLVTIGILFLATQMSACKDATEIDPGILGKNTYSNEFFGFEITLPDDWYLLDQQGMNAVSQAGGRAVAGKNKRLKAAVKAAKNGSHNLVMAYEHPVGTRVPFNPAIGAVAQRLDMLPGVRSGRDYLLYLKRFMSQSRIRVDFSPEIGLVKVGGVYFDHVYAEANLGNTMVSQEYYASVRKGYVLSFLMSYVEGDQYGVLQKSIDSIVFH